MEAERHHASGVGYDAPLALSLKRSRYVALEDRGTAPCQDNYSGWCLLVLPLLFIRTLSVCVNVLVSQVCSSIQVLFEKLTLKKARKVTLPYTCIHTHEIKPDRT